MATLSRIPALLFPFQLPSQFGSNRSGQYFIFWQQEKIWIWKGVADQMNKSDYIIDNYLFSSNKTLFGIHFIYLFIYFDFIVITRRLVGCWCFWFNVSLRQTMGKRRRYRIVPIYVQHQKQTQSSLKVLFFLRISVNPLEWKHAALQSKPYESNLVKCKWITIAKYICY